MRAAENGMCALVKDALEISSAKNRNRKEKMKYVHLLNELSKHVKPVNGKDSLREALDLLGKNAIPVDQKIEDWRKKAHRQGREFTEAFELVKREFGKRTNVNDMIRVIYVVPSRNELQRWIEDLCEPKLKKFMKDRDKVEVIDFSDIATYAKEQGNIGKRFAKSLEKWTKQAGSCPPQP